MVRTRRKNKSKKRTNRKRTTRRLRGGATSFDRRVSTPNSSNCGAQQSLCRVGIIKPIDINLNVNFQCMSCKFTVTSPLVYKIINQKCYIRSDRTLDMCRKEINEVIDNLNNTKKVSETERLVINIKGILSNIGIEQTDYETKVLIKWLPLKQSDFYNSTFTGLVKAITGG